MIKVFNVGKTSLVLLASSTLAFLFAQLFVPEAAQAECKTPDGQTFQTGETAGPYVCMPDGSWKPY